MKPDDKHKKKATRQWQAKNGIVAPKLSKQQKDKERVKQLQSNWDRWFISVLLNQYYWLLYNTRENNDNVPFDLMF